ncbi:hypothetical protein ACA910_014158 [Epithemia clementina (nom. ined.)]
MAPSSNQTGSAPLNPTDDAVPMLVHVTAPATLPAGYTFEAEINGNPDNIITCEVPEGGVTEGQMFLAPLPVTYDGARLRAPVGRWKDGLFGCFNYGICHASLCCSLWCTPIAMGQTITRMNLTWLGEPGTWNQAQRAFQVICVLVCCSTVYSISLSIGSWPYEIGERPTWLVVAKFLGACLVTFWSVYSLCRTRETVRARYQIPEENCTGCEDLCCSLWCSCCAAAQLLRHTGEYETYPGVCCSSTGHPEGTPKTV